jgi:hypothetical protein
MTVRAGSALSGLLVVLAVTTVGCSTKHRPGPTMTSTISVAATTSVTETVTPAPVIDASHERSACSRLKSDFASVLGFELVSAVVAPGDIAETMESLTRLGAHMPGPPSASLADLVTVLGNMDDAAMAGKAGNADTSTVQRDIQAVVRFCTSHGYPNPDPEK